MKIALCQLNYTIGDFDGNTAKIIAAINKAKAGGAELAVFSELSVCGYPPLDFLENRDFIQSCQLSLQKIADASADITTIVGCPVINPAEKGKKLFNAAVAVRDGKIVSDHYKTLLPTYDVFDEYRYFEPNREFRLLNCNGKKIAVTVCEDLWDNQPVENSYAREKLYTQSPMEQLSGAELIINIASSPFSVNQAENRLKVLKENALKYGLPVIYVNQVGANTELIFDGGSMVVSSEGNLTTLLSFFAEDVKIADTDNLPAKPGTSFPGIIERIHDALVLGIRDYFTKSGFSKAVVGLSGGIDSALTVVLAARALGEENVHCLMMPSRYSSTHSVSDSLMLASNISVSTDMLSIEAAFSAIESSLLPLFAGKAPDVTEENIQARIRGLFLMAWSNKFGSILLNTSNKSEAATGYGTLYGDMNGGLSVLGDLYKTQVYQLASYINRNGEVIPRNILIKAPSAELRPDQKDSDSLPEYNILDKILELYIERKYSTEEIIREGFDSTMVKKVIRLVNMNEYKRFQAPPILRVSPKAFGHGRRMPLVGKY